MFDASIGILIPLYDKENDLLLLGKKGDNTIQQIGLGPDKLYFFSKYIGKYFELLLFTTELNARYCIFASFIEICAFPCYAVVIVFCTI